METSSKTNDFKPIPPDHRPLVKRNSASALPEERRVTSPILSPYSNDIEFNLSPLESTKKSSIAGATLNFTNSIIGAGIISLPYAISQAGIVLGSVLLIGIAFLVDWTALLLVRAGKLSGQTSYQSIMGVTFGRWGSWSITAFQVIFAFGAMIAYVIIIGDTLPAVFHSLFGTSTSSWFFSRMGFIVMSTVVLLPLSLLNNLNSLSTTSAISLVFFFFFFLYI
ncbi:hypothetical protein HMI54_001009 [Coelomomyces lativittatus]|nr:hypothetical protein HMI54_001009 [Coelomomyces lativittatus]